MATLADFDIKGCITRSVADTFSTMLTLDIEPAQADIQLEAGVNRMVGALNFAGKVTGVFNVQVSIDFGRIMAGRMLEQEPEEVDPATDVRDLIAEITNIVGGNLKSALNDAGHPCVLSTPSITYGTDFTIRSLSMDRFEHFLFQYGEHYLIIEAGLKAVDSSDTGLDFSTPDAMNRMPNVNLEKLNALDYHRQVSRAVIDVFDTMFSLKLDLAESVTTASLTGTRNVSSVCFAGDATGIVSIHVDLDLTRRMAANMLGVEPEEVEDNGATADMLGELGNIVGGNLKSALTDTGLRCALSTPSFTTGSDFMIEALNLERYERLAFQVEDHTVFTEMGVKISELAKAATPYGKEVHYSVADALPEASAGAADAAPAAGARPKTLKRPAPPKPAAPPPPPEPEAPPPPDDFGLDILLDIPVDLTVELGRTKIPIHELLKLQPGSAVKLAKLEGEPVDILANDVLIARGEVIVRNEKYGLRITEITKRADRLRGLK